MAFLLGLFLVAVLMGLLAIFLALVVTVFLGLFVAVISIGRLLQ